MLQDLNCMGSKYHKTFSIQPRIIHCAKKYSVLIVYYTFTQEEIFSKFFHSVDLMCGYRDPLNLFRYEINNYNYRAYIYIEF